MACEFFVRGAVRKNSARLGAESELVSFSRTLCQCLCIFPRWCP